MPDMEQLPGSDKVRAVMETLIEGSEDARDDLLKDLNVRFNPSERAELKRLVIDTLQGEFLRQDYRLRDPKTAQTVRGWFVGALGSLEPFDDVSAEVLSRLALSNDSEWVRYWSLAQLYWGNAENLELTVKTIFREHRDKENLVHALAMAVQAKRFDPTMVELLKPRLTTK